MGNTSTSYKDSINLPVTGFPMRADLPVREKPILERWQKMDLYGRIRQKVKGRPRFILHDGPPFANGDIHLGHALNKILKDIVIRYRTLKGFDAPFLPGWDCHGLPIEHQVVRKLGQGAQDPVLVRKQSAAYARKYIEIQRKQFERLGAIGDWNHPYITMDSKYEAEIVRVFASLVGKGLVYQSLRPVFWSTGCQTALAEAEVEYEDRPDSSIYLRFPVVGDPAGRFAELQQLKERHFGKAQAKDVGIYLAVWTTTPWTLPANLAVAVHPDMRYRCVKDGRDLYLVAESRLDDFKRVFKQPLEECPGEPFPGKKLSEAKLSYLHPFHRGACPVLLGDFVTAETGTGLVHIAPGHGYDDYVLGQKNQLPLLSPVDDQGCFTDECGIPELVGQYVFKANAAIVKLLKKSGLLVAEEKVVHPYPFCWRSKTPIIFRSVKQWFIRVDAFREEALKAVDEVEWIPSWGKSRIRASIESRHDWCISRQRAWGIPIPVFYRPDGSPILEEKVIRAFAELAEKQGTDIWFTWTADRMAKELGLGGDLRKGSDTLDVWIDSGSSFRAVVEKELDFPADLYLEGSDQHRGWFQSTLLISCGVARKTPYKSVLTHGFVVDGEGKKMSKSLGNVISPQEIVGSLGADVLRLWVASSLFAEDIRVSKDIFERLSDSYRKFRNTLKFLLGNVAGFDPSRDGVSFTQMEEMDRWALSKLAHLIEESERAFDTYQYHRFYQIVYNFCVREMSSFYFDVLKDRLYADAKGSPSGRSCRTALFEIFKAIAKLLSPVLVYTADEAWTYLADFPGKGESVHLQDWPEVPEGWRDLELERKWERLLKLREKVLKKLEEKREKKEIGNSLEAEVELSVSAADDFEFFSRQTGLVAAICLVSSVAVKSGSENGASDVSAVVMRARGKKCARCWNYRVEVGENREHPTLCRRCLQVLKGIDA